MTAYRTEQRHVLHRGREFHFVSYEGKPADPRHDMDATPATWYLLNAGKRWPVMTQVKDECDEEIDRRLIAWLDVNVFS
jgi:hypothetical protein